MKKKERYLMNKLHLMLNMKVKKRKEEAWEKENKKMIFVFLLAWFTKYDFLIECDDSQIICYLFFHRCLHSIKKSKRMQKKIRRSTILKQRKKILEIIIIVFSEDKTSAFLFISSYPKDIVVLNHKEYVISVGSKRNQNISTHFWIRG